MEQPTLASRAGRALSINLISTIAARFGTLAVGVVLARILGPEEFGTFAVALLALMAVLSFNELGVSLAIVRWPGDPYAIAPTVQTLCTLSSIIFFLISSALAPAFCAAMGSPDATWVVIVLSFSVVVNGVVATPAALMQREFRAGQRLLVNQVMVWLGAAISIAGAAAGMGAMSLGVGRVAGAVAGALLFLRWKPVRFGFDRELSRRLLKFGLPLAGSSLVVFSVGFVDQFVVGSVIGPVALGFYVLASNISNWPTNVLSRPVRDVSPAAFARLQGDPPALRSAFLSSFGLLAAITFPACLVLTGAAAPIIGVLYGEEWAPAASALGWLGLLAGMRILFELFYDYFVVLGSSRVVLAVQLIWLVALVPALYAGAQIGGIGGAAAAHVAIATFVVLPMYLRELRQAKIPWRSLASHVAVPVLAGAAVAGVALIAHELIPFDLAALGVAGAGLLVVLALEAKRMRAAVQHLRAVGNVAVSS